MRFGSLVIHGLTALSVYSELIGIRILIFTVALAVALGFLIVVTLWLKMTAAVAVPGWATSTIGILFLLILQISVVAVLFIFRLLAGRADVSFIPVRDYALFVKGVRQVFPREHVP
jgi:hypothetical protein